MKEKPGKPYPEFPLTPHASGKWQKKIKGRVHYFGRWDDPQSALQEYLKARDYLQAGVPVPGDGTTDGMLSVGELCDQFYGAKKQAVMAGGMTARSLKDLRRTCTRLCSLVGKTRSAGTLTPIDFMRIKADLSKALGPVSIGNEIQRIRSVFKWGYDYGLLEKPLRFGPDFKRPPVRVLRQQRQQRGKRLFEAAEIRKLIEAAGDSQVEAMILLGINGGLGQTDIAQMEMRHIRNGWVDFPRPKTSVERRFPLWPESLAALQLVLQNRHHRADGYVFVTKYGNQWVRQNGIDGAWIDSIQLQFSKLKLGAGINRANAGFYALRHTFETVAGNSQDQIAVSHIMGHVDTSMSAAYRETIDDARLQTVVDHVHAWLYRTNATQ